LKICVFGAGAIGGFLAASLAREGKSVSVVARGKQLVAIKARGLTVRSGNTEFQASVVATDKPAELGPQDLLFVALKAPTVTSGASAMESLLGPNTTVVFVMNGIPWWYYYKHGGAIDDQRIPSLDPSGVIWNTIGPERVLGSVVYCSATNAAPGIIELDYSDVRFEFGEPDGSMSPRLQGVVDVVQGKSIAAAASSNIRERIWAKLILNLATGPMAVLSQSRLSDLYARPGIRDVAKAILVEGMAIARSLGMEIKIDAEAAIEKISKSRHKPSILQDLEARKPMEVEALYSVPLAIGRANVVEMPMLNFLIELVKLRAQTAGLYCSDVATAIDPDHPALL